MTSTDLVLFITQLLRKNKVVGSFIEFSGEGVESLTAGDRATIANMAPEYGATAVFFLLIINFRLFKNDWKNRGRDKSC